LHATFVATIDTAAAVIVGSIVILFDPIFQGLAISLMAGEVASLFLSRMTVPVLFYLSERKKHEPPPSEPPVVAELSSDVSEISEVETAVEQSKGHPVDVPVVESPAPEEEAVVGTSSAQSIKRFRVCW
jgi:hypothetical protein